MSRASSSRRCRGVGSLMVVCALAAMLAAPTAASACPSWYAKAKSFHGLILDAEFSGSATGDVGSGGTATVSLDHGGGPIGFAPLTPQPGTHHHDFSGETKGGGFGIDDHYSEINNGQITTGMQSASGPPVSGYGQGAILFPHLPFSSCTYIVAVRFGIVTTTGGSWPGQGHEDHGVSVVVDTPARPIPAGRKLSGHATVNAYCSGPTGFNNITKGWFVSGGLPGGGDAFESAFCAFAGGSPNHPIGTAEIAWSFSAKLPK